VRWFFATFGFLLSWWGSFIVSALDSSLVFVLPFGVDALIIAAAVSIDAVRAGLRSTRRQSPAVFLGVRGNATDSLER
jgi:hypothetical protein